jgi:hypothetical protein
MIGYEQKLQRISAATRVSSVFGTRRQADRALRASAPGQGPGLRSRSLAQGRAKGHPWRIARGRVRTLGCSRLPSLARFACADRVIPHGTTPTRFATPLRPHALYAIALAEAPIGPGRPQTNLRTRCTRSMPLAVVDGGRMSFGLQYWL